MSAVPLAFPRAAAVFALTAVAVFAVSVSPAAANATDAAASPWTEGPSARARLVSAGQTNLQDTPLLLALELDLQPGWKTYWRSPGAAGFGAEIDWSESENFAAAEIMWPRPRRFSLFDEAALGYEGRVLLPLSVTPRNPEQPLSLNGDLLYLVCRELCIPHEARLTLTLPPSSSSSSPPTETGASPFAAEIHAALADVPTPASHQVRLVSQTLTRAGDSSLRPSPHDTFEPRAFLSLTLATPAPLAAPDLFAEAGDDVLFGRPLAVAGDGENVTLTLPLTTPPGRSLASLAEQPLTLTLFDADPAAVPASARGWEIRAEFAGGEGGASAPLLTALLFAFLGGLVLNAMPCVLPVLSLKLLAVVRVRREDDEAAARRELRRGFMLSSLGIFLSFAVLGSAALGARGLGFAVGWGVQFQQPFFLAFMATACVLFSAWLMDWWRPAIPLPQRRRTAKVTTGGTAKVTTGMTTSAAAVESANESENATANVTMSGAAGMTAGGTTNAMTDDAASMAAGVTTSEAAVKSANESVNESANESAPRDSALSHIAAGVLATLLATPCSAPFLGVAVGLAFVLPTAAGALIFFGLALGFATPWLLVALWPSCARLLPKPGAWMIVLERVFALALLATALWLLFVLASVTSAPTALTLAVLFAFALLLLARIARRGGSMSGGLSGANAAAVVTLTLALFLVALLPRDNSGDIGGAGDGFAYRGGESDLWTPFAPRRVGRAVSEGKVVVLTFTADWCITCKVNQAGALSAAGVLEALGDEDTLALLGDWTRPDEEIAGWLSRHGRFGIPFTAVYGPSAPRGVLLPEVLTEGAVLAAIAEARAG
ncbi:MAG: thioredoxin family protein [Alphaproteobacteria bacterium]|nr:thioredoxin family protein [Alphaproteobacteria bacterium]